MCKSVFTHKGFLIFMLLVPLVFIKNGAKDRNQQNKYESVNISSFKGIGSDSEAIESAFDYLSHYTYKRLIIDVDVFIDNAILLPSNTILELQADIFQNDKYYDTLDSIVEHSNKLYGNFDNVIRGANVIYDEEAIFKLPAQTYTASGYVKNGKIIDHYVPIEFPLQIAQLTNIKIIGNNHKIVASKHVPMGYHTRITGGEYANQEGEEEMRGDDWGSRGILMAFSNCSDIYIENVTLCDAHCYSLSFDLCKNVIVNDISIFSPVGIDAEEDGIDIRTGCKNININNIYAETGDDAIAINAGMNGNLSSMSYPLGNNRYLYPLEASINNYRFMSDEELDVCDVVVKNVKSKRVHWDGRTAIIFADLGRTISNVLFEDFEELEGSQQRPENPTIKLYNNTNDRPDSLLGIIKDVRIKKIKAITSNVVVEGRLDCSNVQLDSLIPKEKGKAYFINIPGTDSQQEYKGYVINRNL